MNIKPVGNDLESECVGCGEPLLIGEGDSLNFRMGYSEGIEMPMPEGLLCAACNKQENGDEELIVKFNRARCQECGIDYDPEIEFTPSLDEQGNICGFVCENCSSPW